MYMPIVDNHILFVESLNFCFQKLSTTNLSLFFCNKHDKKYRIFLAKDLITKKKCNFAEVRERHVLNPFY